MKTMLRYFALFLFVSSAFSQSVWWTPAAPRQGDAVTIYYDALQGALPDNGTAVWMHWGLLNPENGAWSTPPQTIWPAGSQLHTDNVAVQSPMTNTGNQVWSLTIDFDEASEAIAFVFTDRANNWDNNSGQNWELTFLAAGTVSWWTPENPEPGDEITIFYDCVPGTLPDGATSVILHWGINEATHGAWRLPPEEMWPAGTVAQGVAARTPMINLGNGLFSVSITTLDTIYSLHYVTTDGSNWDNNADQNWDIILEEPPVSLYHHVIFRFDPRSAFAQYSGQITSVNLAGTFNGWSTSATPLTTLDEFGNRWGEVPVPLGDLEYKFVINGNNWQIDPDNPRNAPGGFNNSLMTVVADSLPQIYDIQPGENRILPLAGGQPEITVHVRGGDLGPGVLSVSVQQNDVFLNSDYNTQTGTLTFTPESSAWPSDQIRIQINDSTGHVAYRRLAFGLTDTTRRVFGVDPVRDLHYGSSIAGDPRDLRSLQITEINGGETVQVKFLVGDATLATDTAGYLLVIASQVGGFSEIIGFDGELEFPDLTSGGVAIPIVHPESNYTDGTHWNRIHGAGDMSSASADSFDVSFNPFNPFISVYLDVDQLESYLGSYQSEWYYSLISFDPAPAAEGYCREVTAADGGSDDIGDPDIYDAIFFGASDIEAKNFKNYGLTRRVTLDAEGRGLAAIAPEEIGPNVAHPGPYCQLLTRGAPTRVAAKNIKGRITSTAALDFVWMTRNEQSYVVTMTGDSLTVPITLEEGDNLFTLWAVDMNGDTGRSAQMNFPLLVDHAPNAQIVVNIGDATIFLVGSSSTDPQNDPLTFHWNQDADNPQQVTLNGADNAAASFVIPTTRGEYYFNLDVTDTEQNTTRARTFVRIGANGESAFLNNEAAEWVDNAIMYEIFPRSFSPQGNLQGITAGLPRLSELGVSVIWLMPIFEGPSDHGYEITDYYSIEQDYGNAADLHELVGTAHDLGIHVILDMVINHTGIVHPFMQDAQRFGRNSFYWDWYDRDGAGNYTYYFDWSSLPNINLDNPETARYYIDMCKYWVQEFDIDGYRCDVAWGPMQRTPEFWVNWRAALKEIKPEVMLLAETGANDFAIFDNRFDLALDWNLHHEGAASFADMFPSIPSFTNLTDLITNYGFPWPEYKNPLRFMENHDETRYISYKSPAQTKLVSELMFTIPGVPMIYAGQEVGETSQRGVINWGTDANTMYPHYYRLMNARKILPAMRTGDFTLIPNSQSGACYSFARTGEGMDPVVFLGNFSSVSQVVSVTIDPTLFGLHPDSTYVVSEILSGAHYESLGSNLTSIFTSLSSYSGRVWVISDSVITTDAPEHTPEVPQKTELLAPYPNPFNPVVTVPFELARAGRVTLRVYDVLGRTTALLQDGLMTAGTHSIAWDGAGFSSGVYFIALEADGVRQTRKMLLLK